MTNYLYNSKWINHNTILVSILVTALFFRLYQFPYLPSGLQQDEISSLIESKSILETGMDRWGNKLPVYFASWGSGQNVLSSYLLLPFAFLFSNSIWAVRLMPILLYILSIWLFYWLIKKWLGRDYSLVGTAILATNPWHVLAARWGLESNLLPIMILLGFCTLTKAVQSSNKFWIYVSLIPFALSFYAYSISLATVPILLFAILVIFREDIIKNFKSWMISFLIFLGTLFPFILWAIKNYITKSPLPFENYLPFSINLFSASRLEQARGGRTTIFTDNIDYYINGMKDTLTFNSTSEFGIFFGFTWIFFWLGLIYLLFTKKSQYTKLVLGWLVSGLTLLWVVPLNVNRNNIIYFPIIIIMTIGVVEIYRYLADQKAKQIYGITLISMFTACSLMFGYFYFVIYPTRFTFPDLQKPFAELSKLPPNYLITNKIELPYIYTLYHTNYPMKEFQKEAISKGYSTSYSVPSFGEYYFSNDLIREKSLNYSFLLEKDSNPCANETITFENKYWKVGQCKE